MSISFETRGNIDKVSVIYKMNFDWGMKISLREGLRFVSWGNGESILTVLRRQYWSNTENMHTFHISNTAFIYSPYLFGFPGDSKLAKQADIFYVQK